MVFGNVKKIELKLGRTGIIIIASGMAVLLCIAFMLGVVVGKNIDTYPEKIASIPKAVLALIWRPAKLPVTPDSVDIEAPEGLPKAGENIDLTFYNDLTSKKGVMKDTPLAEKKMVETPPPQTEAPPQQKEGKIIEPPIVSESQGAKIISEKTNDKNKTETKKTKEPAVAGKQNFIIQAASLKEKVKAYQIIKNISDLGFKSHIVKIDIKGKGTWYRVIVSGFSERSAAQAAVDKIDKKIKTHCIIMRVDADTKKK